jgi:valyl-tRNA synthetase
MVKHRLYKPEIYGEESRKAAQYTLNLILETIIKLLAPVTPHITEELYSELFRQESVHLQSYPEKDVELEDEDSEKAGELLVDIIDGVRKYKSDNNMSLGADLDKAVIESPDSDIVKGLEIDIKGTGRISNLEIKEGKELKVSF